MDQELKDKRRRAAIFLVVLLAVSGSLVLLYMATLGRPWLVGEDHHDFGMIVIPIGQTDGMREHTFTLTNRTGSSITVNRVTTTCGCTATRYAPDVIEPGGTLDVSVALTVSNNGVSNQSVHIHTAERGMRTLTITGVGRREQQLRAGRLFLPLFDDREQTFAVFAEIWPGDLPDGVTEPTLSVDGGDVLHVSVQRWFEQRPASARANTPAIWNGLISVRALEGMREAGAERAVVVVTMQPDHTLEVPVHLISGIEEPTRTGEGQNRSLNPLDFDPGNEGR